MCMRCLYACHGVAAMVRVCYLTGEYVGKSSMSLYEYLSALNVPQIVVTQPATGPSVVAGGLHIRLRLRLLRAIQGRIDDLARRTVEWVGPEAVVADEVHRARGAQYLRAPEILIAPI